MSQTLTISDKVYIQLQQIAQASELKNMEGVLEKLLETWQIYQQMEQQRRDTISQISTLRERLQQTYGVMPDSVELIREDRER